ncbi:MAG: IrrE N-terminal-like domain [Acidobacteriota bacterium]|jgi:hypothetical protein|nr:IrrE N-terminal-like domain [Acidobacteriota bacterium]
MALSPSRAYFSALGCAGRNDFESRVVDLVQRAWSGYGCRPVPVRLNKIAPHFQVRALPRSISSHGEASINFDQQAGEFVISLGSRCNVDSRKQIPLWQGDFERRRLRFTYAHELAHRFCFVGENSSWLRAIHLIARGLQGTERSRVVRILGPLEEAICNTVASRLLVPDLYLQEFIGRWGGKVDPCGDFFSLVTVGAHDFEVSRECFLGAIKDASERGVIELGRNFFSVVVHESDRKGRSRSPRWLPRVMFPIVGVASQLGTVLPPFPGMAVSGLGSEIAELINKSTTSDKGCGSIGSIPLILKVRQLQKVETQSREILVDFRFHGWWRTWSQQERRRTILVWGQLEP